MAACDVVVAAATATFAISEVRVGLGQVGSVAVGVRS
jgi:enoyl-CoA hydratase/carnithine racemase